MLVTTLEIPGSYDHITRVEVHTWLTGINAAELAFPDFSRFPDTTPEPAEEAWCGDGYGVRRWDLGSGRSFFLDFVQGEYFGHVSRDDLRGHLADWDLDGTGYETFAEMLAGFGLDGLAELDEALEDWAGPCRVWRRPCYYHGTYNAPTSGFSRDDNGAVLEFPDYDAAAAYVSEYYNAPSGYDGIPACNVLSHGQAGPDTLTIVKAD